MYNVNPLKFVNWDFWNRSNADKKHKVLRIIGFYLAKY